MGRFERDLLDLRSGELSFERFVGRNRGRFQRWASYFIDRYRPHGLDLDDLVQDGLLEAWRAVDGWQEEKASIVRRVEYKVGERMDREVKRALGWPRKDRPVPAQQVFSPLAIEFAVSGSMGMSKRIELEGVASRLETPFERDVTIGIGLGASIRVVAAHLYADPKKRLWYEFDSPDHAVRRVRSMVKRVTKTLEGAR